MAPTDAVWLLAVMRALLSGLHPGALGRAGIQCCGCPPKRLGWPCDRARASSASSTSRPYPLARSRLERVHALTLGLPRFQECYARWHSTEFEPEAELDPPGRALAALVGEDWTRPGSRAQVDRGVR